MLRHWLVIGVVTATPGGAAYAGEARHDPVFETAAQLEFGDVQRRALVPEDRVPRDPARQLSNRTGHMRSSAVLDRAVERLGGDVARARLRRAVEILADPDRADTVTILARSGEPEQAAAFANAVAEAYQDVVSGRERTRLEAAVVELDQTIERLLVRLRQVDADAPAPAEGPSAALLQRRSIVGELVELTARRERLATAAALAGADVFVLSSRWDWEGVPLALLEALACGTPAVVSPTVERAVPVAARGLVGVRAPACGADPAAGHRRGRGGAPPPGRRRCGLPLACTVSTPGPRGAPGAS